MTRKQAKSGGKEWGWDTEVVLGEQQGSVDRAHGVPFKASGFWGKERDPWNKMRSKVYNAQKQRRHFRPKTTSNHSFQCGHPVYLAVPEESDPVIAFLSQREEVVLQPLSSSQVLQCQTQFSGEAIKLTKKILRRFLGFFFPFLSFPFETNPHIKKHYFKTKEKSQTFKCWDFNGM